MFTVVYLKEYNRLDNITFKFFKLKQISFEIFSLKYTPLPIYCS